MASKNTNIVSKTLVESYVRKQVKALKQSPTETINTLTKQLLDKPKGSLGKYLLHITPEKLQDTQSGYYKLFHDILPKINKTLNLFGYSKCSPSTIMATQIATF